MDSTIRPDTAERHKKKYENKNLIHRLFLGRFFDVLAGEIKTLGTGRILDFGCGEGFFWKEVHSRGVDCLDVTGIDLREDALEIARATHPQYRFLKQDVLTWQPDEKFDLVIASQVLEHLPHPGNFLAKLTDLSRGHLILTVPWEPFFRIANLLRGHDILRLGNHPEHVNLWGARQFERFVASFAEIEKFITVFPFLVVVCKPKERSQLSESGKK